MRNLFNMDLYRMFRAKSFKVCLGLAFLFAAAGLPLLKLLTNVAARLSPDSAVTPFPASNDLSSILQSPLSMIPLLLCLLSVVFFFYADMESGYIKNIAGQMPKRGFSILSRFLASVVHNLIFMAVGAIGAIIGTLITMKLSVDSNMADGILTFVLKLLLLQAICSVLLLVTASLRSKSFGIVLAVLFGVGAMTLLYSALDSGLDLLIKGAKIEPYMPDTLWDETRPDTVRALLSGMITVGIFLPLSIRVFDHKDVK